MENIDIYVQDIRNILAGDNTPEQNKKQSQYIDLGETVECSPEQLQQFRTALPCANPVHNVFSKIILSLNNYELTNAKYGINELFQHYLLHTGDNELGKNSLLILEHIYLIVLYFGREGYPYERYFFDYLMRCYHPVCSCLLSAQKQAEIELFTNHIVFVGKIAASRQVDTCGIHHLLRNIETFASAHQLKDLASKAKESRHNLEI